MSLNNQSVIVIKSYLSAIMFAPILNLGSVLERIVNTLSRLKKMYIKELFATRAKLLFVINAGAITMRPQIVRQLNGG